MELLFKDYLIGVVLVVLLTAVAYFGFRIFFPVSHFNLLECYGIVMVFVTINNGRIMYNVSKKKTDADISE